MMDKDKHAGAPDDVSANSPPALRQQAEARLLKKALSPENIEVLSPETTRKILHELRVHQIELEMQNEELRESQAALDIVRTRYFDLYDLAPVGYCTISEQGLIMQANLTIASLLGVTRSTLVKKPLTRFIHKEDEDRYYLHRRKLVENGDPQPCELRMVKHDGTQIWVHLAATVAHDVDGTSELRVVLSDISERKRIETERNEAFATANKASLAKTEFLSRMSHELRTPLNAILGFAQLMQSGTPPPTPSQKGSIERILTAGWYLLELINEVLDLAQIESGKVILAHEPVLLVSVMQECFAMIEPQAQQRGIDLTFPQADLPYFLSADRTRLKQVLINLLFNAVKYNRPGGKVTVECTLTRQDSLRIGVRDTGLGLTPAEIAQLFQPFNRLGKEAGAEEGTGIGLVVAKRLIEMMGGVIGVESSVGIGSIFWIELRLTAAPQLEPLLLEHAPPVQPPAPEITPRYTVLYVEDNPTNLALVEQIIERRADLRLLSTADGNQGIEFARTQQPAVILMDINLPGINGTDAMKILRADPITAHIPIIAISANALPHDVEKALLAGFFSYITKPIRINELVDVLDVALKMAETAARSRS